MGSWSFIKEANGYALIRSDTGVWSVVQIDRSKGMVYSLVPGDGLAGSVTGKCFARITDDGIDSVAAGYSESYAKKQFKILTETD
jgi:hypothetical protein